MIFTVFYSIFLYMYAIYSKDSKFNPYNKTLKGDIIKFIKKIKR